MFSQLTAREWIFLATTILSIAGFFGSVAYLKKAISYFEETIDKLSSSVNDLLKRIETVEINLTAQERTCVLRTEEYKTMSKDVKALTASVNRLIGELKGRFDAETSK